MLFFSGLIDRNGLIRPKKTEFFIKNTEINP